MTMIVVNIFEAKAKLSEYLDMAANGERVLICKRNRPVVELHAVQSARTAPRPIGLARGRVAVPPSFFDPLPDEELDLWEGTPSPGFARRPRADQGASRVAEGKGSFGASTKPRTSRRRKP